MGLFDFNRDPVPDSLKDFEKGHDDGRNPRVTSRVMEEIGQKVDRVKGLFDAASW